MVAANDYYPFGMLSRTIGASAKYRFGFNGQEMSNEIKGLGNSYTALYWEYDSRIGRRGNLDPKPTTGVSEYSTFKNNPILLNDVLGDTSKLGTRVMGGVKVLGGLIAGAGSAAFGATTSWTGVGAVVGGAGVVYFSDVIASGAKQMWTGEEESTFTNKAITTGLQQKGVSPENAKTVANYSELGLGLFLGSAPTTKLWVSLTPEVKLTNQAATLAKADAAAVDAAAKVMASKVSAYAKENSIYSGNPNNAIAPEIIKKYLDKMKAQDFAKADPREGIITGHIDKAGRYLITDGHHRMNAAIQYAIEKGDNTFVQQLLKNAVWRRIERLQQYGLEFKPFPTK